MRPKAYLLTALKFRLKIYCKKISWFIEALFMVAYRVSREYYLLYALIDYYRFVGDIEKSLYYAERLILCCPNDANGYKRAAQDLLLLNRRSEALQKIQEGLAKSPRDLSLLGIAHDIYFAVANRRKCLELSLNMIRWNPNHWDCYIRAAQDLISLQLFDELGGFASRIRNRSFVKDLELVNHWNFVAKAGAIALHDVDNDSISNISIDFTRGRDIFIPIGDLCLAAQFLTDSGLRNRALPFDWLFVEPSSIKKIIETDFENFINLSFLETQYPLKRCNHSLYGNSFFNHHDPSREPDRSAFERRINRFNDLLLTKSSRIMFFNVRLHDRQTDLVELLSALPVASKILSFIFLDNGTHEKPALNFLDPNVLQVTFRCDTQNTYFAKRMIHPSRYTDGLHIYCPYSSLYATSILERMLTKHHLH